MQKTAKPCVAQSVACHWKLEDRGPGFAVPISSDLPLLKQHLRTNTQQIV